MRELTTLLDNRNRLRRLRGMEFEDFCADILGVTLWSKQLEIGDMVNDPCNREVVAGTGHS